MPALAGLLLSSSACTADRLAAPDEAEAVQRLADDRAEQPPEDAAPSYDAATREQPPSPETKPESMVEKFRRRVATAASVLRAVVDKTEVRLDRESGQPVTDVYLTTTEVIRGERRDPLMVTVDGGTFDNIIAKASHESEFHIGGEYIILLLNDVLAQGTPQFPGYGFSAEVRGDEIHYMDARFPAVMAGFRSEGAVQ